MIAHIHANRRLILFAISEFFSDFSLYLTSSILLARLFIRPNYREAQHFLVNQPEDLRDINNLTLSYLKSIARYGRNERAKAVDDKNEHNGLREWINVKIEGTIILIESSSFFHFLPSDV